MDVEWDDLFDDDLDILEIIDFGFPRRIIYDRTDDFNNLDDLSFFRRYRLTKPTKFLGDEWVYVNSILPHSSSGSPNPNIVATAILHNIAIEEGEENPPPPDNIDNVNLENNFENGQIDAQPLDGEHDFLHNIAIEEGEENPPPPDNIDNVNLENNFENGQIDAQPLDGEHDFHHPQII
ncbi:hypothetical protein QE152_g8848 [Popillia japonica]|uniref:Uncharacterized protein n=1 Tax=Popillia japonica TaxID=7064 RepID=A0AAW1M1V5_POPJA